MRFDPVYHGHFKCNLGSSDYSEPVMSKGEEADARSVRHDYPNINRWLKNLYWNHPEFKDTTDFDRELASEVYRAQLTISQRSRNTTTTRTNRSTRIASSLLDPNSISNHCNALL